MQHSFSRRTFLGAGAALPFAGAFLHAADTHTPTTVLPVIHCTDLFHPHGDPDDHFDLATIFALAYQGLIDLRGIGIDYPPKENFGSPDIMGVAQLNWICGLNVPTFIGTPKLVSKKTDTLPDLSRQDSAGIRWLIESLKKSDHPVAITVVGSSTDVAIASRREPELFREKCAGVYLNAGSANQTSPELEYNVAINPAAYAAMFDLPCPLYWFPCFDTVNKPDGEWGTYFVMPHKDAFEGVKQPLLSFFWYMFSRSQDTRYLQTLKTPPPEEGWNNVLAGRRGMWCTATICMLAGMTVTKAGKIVPAAEAGADAVFRMEPVKVQCADNGRVTWELSKEATGRFLFHVLDIPAYTAAMTQAVRELLTAFPETI